jgi:hypothetical protein
MTSISDRHVTLCVRCIGDRLRSVEVIRRTRDAAYFVMEKVRRDSEADVKKENQSPFTAFSSEWI